jgi:peroxiredoxin
MLRNTSFPLALALAVGCAVPAFAGTVDEDFAQIQSTLEAIQGSSDQNQQMQMIERIYGECGAFLDSHLAEANEEQLTMACGIWMEVATSIVEEEADVLQARVDQLRGRADLPEQVQQMLAQVEGTLAISPGKTAPNWTCADVHTGEEVSLEDYRGQLVLMDFWATWCPPCRSLMEEELAPLHARYEDEEGFILIGISDEDAPTQLPFAEEHDYHWKKVIDAESAAGQAYGVRGIPFLVLVDEEGTILVAGSGWAVIEEVKAALAERLDGEE